MIIIGPPPIPANVTLRLISPETMNISWLTPNPNQNINTSYVLTVVAMLGTTYMQQTLHTFHIFSPTGALCEEFEVQVTAKNDAGESVPSEAVTARLPLDVSTVESSLQHSVMKRRGVEVLITHQVSMKEFYAKKDIHFLKSRMLYVLPNILSTFRDIEWKYQFSKHQGTMTV